MITLIALLLSLTAPLSLAAPSSPRSELAPLHKLQDPSQAIADKYIVKLNSDSTISALDEILSDYASDVDHVYSHGSFRGFASTLDSATVDLLRAHPHVNFIEQDSIVKAASYVEQPGSPWGLARISSRKPGATKYVYDDSAGAGTCSYIVDTGIEDSHPEFQGRATQLISFTSTSTNTDDNGHGTFMAGIVGAATYGVAKNTTLVGIKVLDAAGSGTTAGVIAGLNYVAQNLAARDDCPRGGFVNLGFLGGASAASLNAAVSGLVSGGIFVAAAAGDNADDASKYSPGNIAAVCTVSSIDSSDQVPSSSNYGSVVDVYAPGKSILSTYRGGVTATLSGTSTAAPHVCGLAAYLSTLQLTTNPASLCDVIKALATPSGTRLIIFNGNPQG